MTLDQATERAIAMIADLLGSDERTEIPALPVQHDWHCNERIAHMMRAGLVIALPRRGEG